MCQGNVWLSLLLNAELFGFWKQKIEIQLGSTYGIVFNLACYSFYNRIIIGTNRIKLKLKITIFYQRELF